MCESTAYVIKADSEEKLMENVAHIKPLEGGKFLLRGLLGESVEVEGAIEEINLMSHKIVFRPAG